MLELYPVPHQAAHSTEALAKLIALLGPIGDELKFGAEGLVVLHDPFDEQNAVDDIQLHARFRISVELLVLCLRGCQEKDLLCIRVGIFDLNSLDLQLLPHDQRGHGAHLKPGHRVLDAEAILSGVLRYLVQEASDEPLLLNEFHILERLGCELNRLVEAVLSAIRDIQKRPDEDLVQPRIEEVARCKVLLELCGPGDDQACDVGGVVRDEHLGGQLGDLPHEVVPLLQPQSREPQRGLTATAMFLREVHGEFVQNLPVVPLQRPVQGAIAIHDEKAEPVVTLEQLRQRLCVELVVT
mmetsp:Transcript_20649/g.59797  ORF Transcript_20649/g.59797 Transcript_20649/m.59797 type:complete len:297 (+) Transcript_20649:155-1045(+)